MECRRHVAAVDEWQVSDVRTGSRSTIPVSKGGKTGQPWTEQGLQSFAVLDGQAEVELEVLIDLLWAWSV